MKAIMLKQAKVQPQESDQNSSKNLKPQKNICQHYLKSSLQICAGTLQHVSKAKLFVMNAINDFFDFYGKFVYENSFTLIVFSFCITLALSCGILLKKTESDIYLLYASPNTESAKIKEVYETKYYHERLESIIISSNQNILTRNVLESIALMTDTIEQITFPKFELLNEYHEITHTDQEYKDLPDIIGYNDLCIKKIKNECMRTSVLDLYDSEEEYGNSIKTTIYPLSAELSVRAPHIDSILGNYTMINTTNPIFPSLQFYEIVSATAILSNFFMSGDPQLKLAVKLFEQKVIHLLQSLKFRGDISISYNMERTLDDELLRASTMNLSDYYNLVLGSFFLLVYAVVSKSNFTIRNKTIPIIMGILSALLAYLSAAGLLYLLGIKHVAPAEAVPFLIIGIGADDCFVLINSYSLLYIHDAPQKRIKLMLRSAGTAITVTTMTNLCAFTMGLMTPFYSLKIFCLTASVSLLFTYILCLTFFIPFVCIDARREHRGKWFYSIQDIFNKKSESHPWADDKLEIVSNSPSKHASNSCLNLEIGFYNRLKHFPKSYKLENFDEITRLNNFKNKFLTQKFDTNIYDVISAQFRVHKLITKLRSISKKIKFSLSQSTNNSSIIGPKWDAINNHTKSSLPQIKISKSDSTAQLSSAISTVDSNNIASDESEEMTIKSSRKETAHQLDNLISNIEVNYKFLEEPNGNLGKYFRLFIKHFYSRWLGNNWIRIVLLIFFAVIFAFFGFMIPNLKHGLIHNDFTLPDSYLRDFTSDIMIYFREFGYKSEVFFPNYENWENKNIQKELLSFHDEINKSENSGVMMSGMQIFLLQNKNDLPDETILFNEKLRVWLNSSIGRNFYNDFTFDDKGILMYWRFQFYIPLIEDTLLSYKALDTIQSLAKNKRPYFHSLVFSKYATLWESDATITHLTLTSLAYTLAAIILISLILIPSFLSSFYALLMIVLVDLCIFGSMALFQIKLNLISMVILLISIGYSVDYTVHVAHSFVHSKNKSKKDRVSETLILMVPPLTDGMITTFMPLIVLGFSQKYILLLFFQLMSLILVFAYTQGVILLPIILSLFGPDQDKSQNLFD